MLYPNRLMKKSVGFYDKGGVSRAVCGQAQFVHYVHLHRFLRFRVVSCKTDVRTDERRSAVIIIIVFSASNPVRDVMHVVYFAFYRSCAAIEFSVLNVVRIVRHFVIALFPAAKADIFSVARRIVGKETVGQSKKKLERAVLVDTVESHVAVYKSVPCFGRTEYEIFVKCYVRRAFFPRNDGVLSCDGVENDVVAYVEIARYVSYVKGILFIFKKTPELSIIQRAIGNVSVGAKENGVADDIVSIDRVILVKNVPEVIDHGIESLLFRGRPRYYEIIFKTI